MINNKTLLSASIALALGGVSLSANAALTTSAVLDFTGTFGLDTGSGAGAVLTPIQSGPDGGIHIGVIQDTNGHNSHGGAPHNKGGLDKEWLFSGNSGMHFTSSPITVVDNDVNNDGGFTQTLDFSGWRVTWNGVPSITLGGGIQDCGTSTDGICVISGAGSGSVDIAGSYDNGSGLATITCSAASCSISSTFTLTYAAVIPSNDPSNFNGVPYSLDITGKVVSAVPIPAAVWLFGSGLAGLFAVSRRRKNN
ncbi:MAG: VPLPA-CTERM sorting domain-containing protein [Gammaproteobacteria bacterium]|nr:VPLPA-CTERM sorting domain-containing protein [Gammaproteobacteria bacterium]